ncbi:rhomboid mitochondrial [Micractinium conductrix]|uniref:Rhomboid mitochondrial n=1 Tax=Micractinium conductrix TaxID=554055 RepID=A0A2P6VPM7_9CHLO|nr:rhomboid mitochondrial [Micractinium conductrix]|eukprot:PSC76042.1 rhomboid mitochondrial [Micractinium conductrix]
MERAGPVIPQPYSLTASGGNRDVCLLASVWAAARTVQQYDAQPATAALVAAQAALYLKPKGYALLQVGTNAHRVLHHGEWRRVAAGAMLHSNVPHLLGNCSRLVSVGMPMERRLGSPGFAALAAACAAASSALYLLSARLAAGWLPDSGLAHKYFMSFPVGFSGALLALSVRPGQWGRAGRLPRCL